MLRTFAIACAALLAAQAASAGSIDIRVDSELAEYVVATACSNAAVDEAMLRASPALAAQLKHHAAGNADYTIDAYIAALQTASRCEIPEPDLFRLRSVVENKPQMEKAIAFLKSRAGEIALQVAEETAPYVPSDLKFSGDVVLSAAGKSCGGFSMDGAFFIDVPCIAPAVEEEYEAIKVLAAHETYHALQYAFFAPFSEDVAAVNTAKEAQAYFFLTLLIEGTAEYVADSRDVPGEGDLATIFRRFAKSGYQSLKYNFRLMNYAVETLSRGDGMNRRMRDMYSLGFSGNGEQRFYYAGAHMAKTIEAEYGREELVCIMGLAPAEFVLAYDGATRDSADEETIKLGPAIVSAAKRLRGERRYESCVEAAPT